MSTQVLAWLGLQAPNIGPFLVPALVIVPEFQHIPKLMAAWGFQGFGLGLAVRLGLTRPKPFVRCVWGFGCGLRRSQSSHGNSTLVLRDGGQNTVWGLGFIGTLGILQNLYVPLVVHLKDEMLCCQTPARVFGVPEVTCA